MMTQVGVTQVHCCITGSHNIGDRKRGYMPEKTAENQNIGKVARLTRSAADYTANIGPTIRKYRRKAGMSQTEFADQFDTLRQTVGKWETGKAVPNMSKLIEICEWFNIPKEELFGLSMQEPGEVLTAEEKQLIDRFREMGPMFRRLLLHTAGQYRIEEEKARIDAKKQAYSVYRYVNSSASAGTGNEFSDSTDFQYKFIRRSRYEKTADCIVRVSGRSMEPVYHDGDYVYVRNAESAEPGEDVICSFRSGLIIKRLDEYRRLFSLNPDYPFGNDHDQDDIRINGIVLGVADPDDIASEEDARLLEDINGDRIRELQKACRNR